MKSLPVVSTTQRVSVNLLDGRFEAVLQSMSLLALKRIIA